MGKSAPPVDGETDGLVSHVRFETEVLAVVLDRSGSDDPPTYAEKIDRSVELNAAWIALRGLLAFFANHQLRDSDARATDYAPDWQWPVEGLSSQFREEQTLRDRISQRVAHITADRVRDSLPLPELSEVRSQVDLLLAAFDDKVDDKDKHRFHRSLDAALQHVRTADPDGSSA